jgi:hypothetical protein
VINIIMWIRYMGCYNNITKASINLYKLNAQAYLISSSD